MSRDVNIVVKLTYFWFDRLWSTKTHNHHGHHENIHGSYDGWRVIGTRFDGLVFRTFLSENCYTSFLTLVQ